MEKSIKILRGKENFERKKQSKFRKPKSTLRKFRKPKFSVWKISQTPIYLANNLRKILQVSLSCELFKKISQPSTALRTPCKNGKTSATSFRNSKHLANTLRKLKGFANLFRNPNTQIRNLANSNSLANSKSHMLNFYLKATSPAFSSHSHLCLAKPLYHLAKLKQPTANLLKRRTTLLAPF